MPPALSHRFVSQQSPGDAGEEDKGAALLDTIFGPPNVAKAGQEGLRQAVIFLLL